MRRYSRCSRYRTKTHDKRTISHDISHYSRYQTAFPKLEEIISTLVEYKKCSDFSEHFLLSLGEQLSLPLRASEVIFDSEVHGVSEVSPKGEVKGKLNFTWCIKVAKQLCTNFTASQLHFRDSENFTILCPSLQFPSTSVIATPKSPLISTFTSSKNTKPRVSDLSSTICI